MQGKRSCKGGGYRVRGVLAALREGLPYWRVVVCANLPTFRLSSFSTCWEVGKLESWEVGGARWCERKSRKTGEGQPCKRERTQDRAYQKKGGGHTRLHLSPMKGRRRKESAPTHSHRTGRREERGINHSTEKGIPRTITPAQGGVDGTPGKTPLANGQLLPT